MANRAKRTEAVPSGTFRQFRYDELNPNPQNPRRLFDRAQLDVLEDSIRKNGILVPLTVYQEDDGKFYILDGERRWKCAQNISTDPEKPREVPIPANIVDPPSNVANVLWMFNIHNLRESWELMPTALSLEILEEALQESSDEKLAELTQLSVRKVRHCKTLLSFDKKYQRMMLHPDPDKRVKANFFLELAPVLDLYDKLPKRRRGGKSRNDLIDHFLMLYEKGKIPSVVHFRRILEANDYLSEDEDRYDEFLHAAQTIASSQKHTIRGLFDPLVAADKSVATAEGLCRDFLKKLRRLKISHTTRRGQICKLLASIQKHVSELLSKLED